MNTTHMQNEGWLDVQPPAQGSLVVNLGQVQIEHGNRYLLTVNEDGTPNVREIPSDSAIANTGRYLEMMTEGNGTYVSSEVLQRFVDAATKMIEGRSRYAERKKLALAGDTKGVGVKRL